MSGQVEAQACDHGAHVHGCQSCEKDAEGLIALCLGAEWLAAHDRALRESIAADIEARARADSTTANQRAVYRETARIALGEQP